jgi:tetratricopeptide (TPR) repeat protein
MEASTNQGNDPLPSAAPASGDALAEPLKLQLEVTLPQSLGGELKAWRKAFERFSDVMERWLESSLAHPGLPAPPPMPWPVAPPRPAEQPATLPPARAESPPPPAPLVSLAAPPILPDEFTPLLVDEARSLLTQRPQHNGEAMSPAAVKPVEVRAAPVETAVVPETDAVEEAAALAQRGERRRAAGQKEEALKFYRQALERDADCIQAYLGRASVYIEQGCLEEALADCNSALQREPERAVLYVLRGLVYTRLGNHKRALDEAGDAIRFDPQLPSAYMLRGTTRFKRGMVGEALADVKQAIRLRPNDPKFYAELGRLLAHTGQHEQAARVYAKVLQLAPTFHEARLQRGMALRQAGEVADAESELTEYLRRRPAAAAGHYQRGLCRLAQKHYAQATTDFDKALALNPDDKATLQAKQQTLDLWEGTARQGRSDDMGATASTVARAATATEMPPVQPTQPYVPPVKPTPPKFKPPKPTRNRSRSRRDDDEPGRWVRPVKWVCTVALVGLLGFGGFRLLANIIHNPHKPDTGPPATATLSADDLFQRFNGNAASAKSELVEHYIEVSGPVARHFEDKSPPVVQLAVTRSNTTVNCTLKANPSLHQQMMLSRIEGECQATLIGLCSGLQGNTISLSECRIVKVAKGRGGMRRN